MVYSRVFNKKFSLRSLFLYFCYSIIFVLLSLRDIGNLNVNKFIFVFIAIIILFVSKYDDIICFLCLIFPLLTGLPGNYILMISMFFIIIKFKKISIFTLVVSLVILCWEILLQFMNISIDIVGVISYFVYILILFHIIYDYNPKDNSRVIYYYSIGSLYLLISILLQTINSTGIDAIINNGFRLGMTKDYFSDIMRLSLNANSLAYFSIILSGISLVMVSIKKDNKPFYIVCLVISLVIGALSVSRSWVVVLLIASMFYILIILISRKNKIKNLIFLFALSVVMYFIISNNSFIIDNFIDRFNKGNTETAGGRFELINMYMNSLTSNTKSLLFGVGIINQRMAINMDTSIHNGFVQILIGYGIIGLIYFMIILFTPIFKYYRNYRKNLIVILPLIIVILFVQTIQFLNPHELVLPYAIGVLFLKNCWGN